MIESIFFASCNEPMFDLILEVFNRFYGLCSAQLDETMLSIMDIMISALKILLSTHESGAGSGT